MDFSPRKTHISGKETLYWILLSLTVGVSLQAHLGDQGTSGQFISILSTFVLGAVVFDWVLDTNLCNEPVFLLLCFGTAVGIPIGFALNAVTTVLLATKLH